MRMIDVVFTILPANNSQANFLVMEGMIDADKVTYWIKKPMFENRFNYLVYFANGSFVELADQYLDGRPFNLKEILKNERENDL